MSSTLAVPSAVRGIAFAEIDGCVGPGRVRMGAQEGAG
jgi:hypothetical protein